MQFKLTPAQGRALALICAAGGGAIMKNGTVLCAGDTGEVDGGCPLHSVTWLRLVAMGLVTGKDGRLLPTDEGRAACS